MDTKKVESVINKWRNDPVLFCEDVLGDTLWEKQKEVLYSLRDNPFTTVRSGHGVGKSAVSARAVVWFLSVFHPSKVITTAPTWNQVETILWSEINKVINKSKFPLGGEVLKTRWRLNDDHFAIGFSTDDPTKFQGHHSPHVLVIFDEATGVKPDIWEASKGLLSNEHARFLAIGNPTLPYGEFYNSFKSSLYNKITISCLESPNVTQNRTVIPGLVTREWVEQMKEEYGENSGIYKSRVLGDFPEEGTDTLISLTTVEKAIGEGKKEGVYVLGVDVARYGEDSTVFSVVKGDTQIYIDGYTGKSTTRTVGEIVNLHKKYDFETIAVDDTGVGGGVTDQLKEIELPVIPVNFGSSARDSEKFENIKAEIFFNLKKDIEESRFYLSPCDKLKEELPSLLYEITSRGKFKIVSKDKLKSLGIPSPDYADATVLSHYALYARKNPLLEFYEEQSKVNTNENSFLSAVANRTPLERAVQEYLNSN